MWIDKRRFVERFVELKRLMEAHKSMQRQTLDEARRRERL